MMSRLTFLAGFAILMSVLPSLPAATSGPHIADLTVLLPPRMTNPVEYRLKGSDGCFSWSWDHHDILSIQPEYNDTGRCSTSARLISIAPYSGRKETAVYAADLRSGTIIRCEVFIDKISKVRIFHHSVKLDLGGLATLQTLAFDEEENVFSSLVGLQFMWQLMPKSSDTNIHHLVHVPLKETPLSDCDGFCGDLNTQIKLEESGVGSDLFVVKGAEIGQEIVSVRLLEPKLEHVVDEIVLTVAEAMSLDPPSPIFITIGASVQYSLRVIRQSTAQVIDLPSRYHRWSTLNSSVAQVDPILGLADALNFGVTSVIVEDTRVSGHQQMSSMHVVIPDKLQLYLVPVTNSFYPIDGTTATSSTNVWYVVVGLQYVVHMKVFYEAQEIYIAKNNDVRLQYNHSACWITSMVPDEAAISHGWQRPRLIKPTSQGVGSLTSEFSYPSVDSETFEVLRAVQQVMVCSHVRITVYDTHEYSQIIHLPWAPKVHQEVVLKASGGCGKMSKDYRWFSTDMATVSVSTGGLVRANKPGKAIIKVVSNFDSMNYDEVTIEVSVPSTMVMLQLFPVEAVVGTHLQAAVTLKSSHGNYFYRCNAFSSFVRWQVLAGSESFRTINVTGELWDPIVIPNVGGLTSFAPTCAWTRLYAYSAGRAMLHATLTKDLWSSDHFFGGPIILKASSLIAAYPPLIARQAVHGNQFGGYWVDLDKVQTDIDKLYLVPGTGLNVILHGGPEPWDQGVEFIESLEILPEDHKPVKDGFLTNQASSGGSLFRISCPMLGSFKLVFSRGNLVGDGHPLPAVETVELSLICDFPTSIAVIANEPVNSPEVIHSAIQADRGPGKIRISPITVANDCIIRVAAVGIHDSGRTFANSSSLCLKWELSGCEQLAYWMGTDNFESIEYSWERYLVLQNKTGQCIARATVIGLSNTTAIPLLGELSFPIQRIKDLSDGVRLQLVSSLRVIPQSLLIFFDPSAKVNLSILEGTCFFEILVNDTKVVEVIQPPASTQCAILSVSPRGLGIANITVHDIGLAPPIAASSLVQVADVDWIKIMSQEEISLMEGATHPFNILAGIHNGSVFDSSQYIYMNIQVHLEDGILELIDQNGFSRPDGGEIDGSTIFIRAAQLGVTTLHVTARQHSGREILSQLIKVEVYAPLRMHPEDVFLSPGASYVITVKGGPTKGVVVEYVSLDEETATIHRYSGRLSAVSAGNTTIRATVYGHGGIAVSEAYGRVKVGIPLKMVLNLQSEQLGVGRQMKVFVSSLEGNLFSFYELCKNYKWTIVNEQVLSFRIMGSSNDKVLLSGIKEQKYLDYSDTENFGFVRVVYGRSAGKTTVSVSFSCDFISSGSFKHSVSYNASESLSVVSDPPLALGVPMTWVLPPFYTTSNLLPSPLESQGEWDSRNRKGSIIYSLLTTCGGKSDLVEQDGIVIDGGRIKTKESDNIACVQAKDRITGKTEIACCVRVAEVAQVTVTAEEFPFYVPVIAVGAKVNLLIGFQDALGNPFHEAYGVVALDIDTNYPDVVSVQTPKHENSTDKVYLQANRQGRALIQISMSNNPLKADYILISVGAHLYPQNPVLTVGHLLNFSITGEGPNDLVSGQWLSSNASVISVNLQSGEAHAIGEGSAEVLFEGSSVKLQTKVTVLRMESVFVNALEETLTNVPLRAKGYKFPLRFSDSHGRKFEGIDRGELLFDCKVEPSFVGYAKPWMDLDTGNKYCLFFPYSPEHLVHSIPRLKETKPEFKSSFGLGIQQISVIASLRQAPQVMGSANALFVGGFSVLVKGKLSFTLKSNKCLIAVIGNTDVELYWNAREQISVSLLQRDDSGIGGHAEYEIKVLQDKSFRDTIVVILPATGQREEIDVSYDAGERDASGREITSVLTVVVTTIAVLVLSALAVVCLQDRPDITRRLVPASAASADLRTPEHSPTSISQTPPRTPQPYIEYVRRTIDETPYYKRHGRRFDPQNTY